MMHRRTTHVLALLVLLCGIWPSVHALCAPGTYFIEASLECGVCPAGEFAAVASTQASLFPWQPSACGRTQQNTIGCSEAAQGLVVEACATDVLNMLQPSPNEYDWDAFLSSIQSAVMGRAGRIVFLMKLRTDCFFVFNTNDHSIQKIVSSIPTTVPMQIDYLAGGVYVPATQSIYSVPNAKDSTLSACTI